jgi:hypothetical protein
MELSDLGIYLLMGILMLLLMLAFFSAVLGYGSKNLIAIFFITLPIAAIVITARDNPYLG